MNRLLIIILISFLTYSCGEEVAVNPKELIAKSIQQKVEKFKNKKRSDCMETIMSDAEHLVDSIIAQQLNLDTISFPPKPIKPNTPELKDLPVNLELKPIKK